MDPIGFLVENHADRARPESQRMISRKDRYVTILQDLDATLEFLEIFLSEENRTRFAAAMPDKGQNGVSEFAVVFLIGEKLMVI